MESTLGYAFSDRSLLRLALTHSSVSKINNERLEFLGDALVDLIIGEYLFKTFPDAQEGLLSRMRATLVKGDSLSDLAHDLGVSRMIRVGAGEAMVAGQYRSSILAGAVEALVGAIYLDSDYSTLTPCLLRWYHHKLQHISLDQSHVDAKTHLQEWLQARRLALPVYTVLSQAGQPHCQTFEVQCHVDALALITQAQGSNRKQAEQSAARLMLEKVGNV
ncbi:MAG: ribonuclease III [Gammaproteobacteria bacterium]|nr:ribonuclease III [Gammaproteobacteria bacterium]